MISGMVTMAGTGQPARKVRVNLSGAELRGSRSTNTDDQGRFSFTALPAGRFTLSVNKPGHLSVTYGQRRPGTPGTPIQLSDGQKFQAQLQIPRGSVLTGVVLDENGEATPGTNVRAMRFVRQGERRTLQSAGSGSTDDRGMYRIFGLQPGDYVVCATPRNTLMSDFERGQVEIQSLRENLVAIQADRGAEEQTRAIQERLTAIQAVASQASDETPSGYAPICYPGTLSTAEASPVALNVGEERPGIDFQLQLVPMARVEGMVLNSTGGQIQNLQVTLQEASALGNSFGITQSARPDNEGRFRISNVAPGQYKLTARAQIGGPQGRAGQWRGRWSAGPGRSRRSRNPRRRPWCDTRATAGAGGRVGRSRRGCRRPQRFQRDAPAATRHERLGPIDVRRRDPAADRPHSPAGDHQLGGSGSDVDEQFGARGCQRPLHRAERRPRTLSPHRRWRPRVVPGVGHGGRTGRAGFSVRSEAEPGGRRRHHHLHRQTDRTHRHRRRRQEPARGGLHPGDLPR